MKIAVHRVVTTTEPLLFTWRIMVSVMTPSMPVQSMMPPSARAQSIRWMVHIMESMPPRVSSSTSSGRTLSGSANSNP